MISFELLLLWVVKWFVEFCFIPLVLSFSSDRVSDDHEGRGGGVERPAGVLGSAAQEGSERSAIVLSDPMDDAKRRRGYRSNSWHQFQLGQCRWRLRRGTPNCGTRRRNHRRRWQTPITRNPQSTHLDPLSNHRRRWHPERIRSRLGSPWRPHRGKW